MCEPVDSKVGHSVLLSCKVQIMYVGGCVRKSRHAEAGEMVGGLVTQLCLGACAVWVVW